MKQSELLRSEAFKLEVALGKIPGISSYNKFGVNPLIDTGTTPEDIWNGGNVYTGFPTGNAEILEILSDNAVDNGVTPNTGARTVIISNLLDENYNEMPDVEVTLNGTTAVSLGTQTYLRASRVQVKTAGSGGANAGTITLRHKTTVLNVFAKIPVGKNQTTIMCFTVPAGKKILVERLFLSMGRLGGNIGSSNVTLRVRKFGTGTFNAIRDVEITNSSAYVYQNNGYMVFDEKDDIKMTVEDVSDNGTFTTAEVDGYIIDPELFHNINI